MKPYYKNKALILYDGECKLCNGSIRFIEKRDHKGSFTYIPIKSDKANRILNNYEDDLRNYDSVLLILNNKILTHSTSILTIARYLSGSWPLLYGLILIPKFIRDPIYKLIAKKRHKWFDRMNQIEQKYE